MRRILSAALVASSATIWGQSLLDPSRADRFNPLFQPQKNEKQFRCEVLPLRPQLNFSFRFQSGYAFRTSLSQFEGSGHRWRVLTRVTPVPAAAATTLFSNYRLQPVPKTKATIESGGLFWVGEGAYNVDWVLADESGRVCRKQWKIEAKLNPAERGINPGIPPHTVAQVSFRRWSAADQGAADVPVLKKLTVFLHAAPLFPRLTHFRVQDRLTLLGSLASLLESVPARDVHLVIFNLDQQKELFRDEAFTPEAFDQAAQSMTNLQLQLVDYSVLKNRRGHLDLLADMIKQEQSATEPSDAVIFIGPPTRYGDKVSAGSVDDKSIVGPRFFYLQYKPYLRATAENADSVELAVKKVHGKKIEIHTPHDFARAIRQVEAQLVARQ